jgi:hypothetical protein
MAEGSRNTVIKLDRRKRMTLKVSRMKVLPSNRHPR